jgi:threonylcarbamoyladenosine tRNA methylthiotransferase MtaB
MNIFLESIGCRLNQSEIEKLAKGFRKAGHRIVASPEEADIVVVNTCVVTGEAASDSRQKIRQSARRSRGSIIVTGCWATFDPNTASELPGVVAVVENLDKEKLVEKVLNIKTPTFELEPIAREPLPGLHLRTRAFTKVQDGCDNHCTYCITRIVRGNARSTPIDEIMLDVKGALAGGVKEIVLTGVHLGAWGQDYSPPLMLQDLIKTILEETDLPRLRLSSLEPWDISPDFFSLWNDKRMCRHLHLPLQTGSEEVLRRMGRKISPQKYSALLQLARSAIPDLAITTDIIAGFPGETEEQFAESKRFVEEMHFAGGHVFNFSPRPGTPAANYSPQIQPAIRKQRSVEMREIFRKAANDYQSQFLGKDVEVLWEATDSLDNRGWRLQGLTDNYLRVISWSPERLWNQISHVRLQKMDSEGLTGKILESATRTMPEE